MMKRIISVSALCVMLSVVLSGCGVKLVTQKEWDEHTSKTEANEVKNDGGDDSDKNNEENDGEADGYAGDEKVDKESGGFSFNVELPEFNKEYDIDETVVYDENGIKITATGIEYTAYSAKLNLLIENDSSKNLSFTAQTLGYSANAVNGYMIDNGYFNCDVTGGNKANESVEFGFEELMIHGITEIADIHVGIKVQDDDYHEICTVDCHVKTKAADSYDYSKDTYIDAIKSGIFEAVYDCPIEYFAEEELYNKHGVRVVSEALIENVDAEKAVLLEVVNESDKMLFAGTANIALNGLQIESSRWSSGSIYPGCRRIMDLKLADMLDKEYWDLFGIKDIGEVSLDFEVLNEDYDDIEVPQNISIKVSENNINFDMSGDEVFNDKGVRIISKGLIEDPWSYSDDIHLLLLVENTSDKEVEIDDEYKSLSVNGFMSDFLMYSSSVSPGKYAILDVEIQDSSLESNNIDGIDKIETVEMTLKIRDKHYKTIAEPRISISK